MDNTQQDIIGEGADSRRTTAKAVEEYLHCIDLERLKAETGLTMDQLSEIAKYRNPKGAYAWDKPRSQSGSRPSYNTFVKLLEAGASVSTLFGVGNPPEPPPPQQAEISDDAIERSVVRVLSRLLDQGQLGPGR